MQNLVCCRDGTYRVKGQVQAKELINIASYLLLNELQDEVLNSSESTEKFLQLALAQHPFECFGVIFLNNQHRVISFENLFTGTINSAPVFPRTVAQRALALNAAAVILSHNHPSGECSPSTADKEITKRLKEALSLIDVRVLDHVIVTTDNTYSFASNGLL